MASRLDIGLDLIGLDIGNWTPLDIAWNAPLHSPLDCIGCWITLDITLDCMEYCTELDIGLDWRMDIGLHWIWHCIGYWIALNIALHWILHAMDIDMDWILNIELDIGLQRRLHWIKWALDCDGYWTAWDIGLHRVLHCIGCLVGLDVIFCRGCQHALSV